MSWAPAAYGWHSRHLSLYSDEETAERSRKGSKDGTPMRSNHAGRKSERETMVREKSTHHSPHFSVGSPWLCPQAENISAAKSFNCGAKRVGLSGGFTSWFGKHDFDTCSDLKGPPSNFPAPSCKQEETRWNLQKPNRHEKAAPEITEEFCQHGHSAKWETVQSVVREMLA